MAIFLDSADFREIAEAATYSLVAGVTTNPSLVARALSSATDGTHRVVPSDDHRWLLPEEFNLYQEILARLGANRKLFAQIPNGPWPATLSAARRLAELNPSAVVVKIPATWDGLEVAYRLKRDLGAQVCVTAVCTATQAYSAALAGADYLAVYVNRYARRGGDVAAWLQNLKEAARAASAGVRILAASVKDPQEAGKAILCGADDLTVPFGVLKRLLDDPMTAEALEQFESDWRGVVRRVR